MARKRKAEQTEEDVEQNHGEEHQEEASRKTTRREEQALAIARRRAAHFANFGGEAAADDENVHVGSNNARTLGPWSSAVELVNARKAAIDQRNSKLHQQAQDQEEDTPWVPARDPALGPRPAGAVPSLFNMALKLLVQHISAVTSLWGVPDTIRSQIAAAACVQRKLSADVAQLFGQDSPSELVIPDCSQLDPTAMLALTELLLTSCSTNQPSSTATEDAAAVDEATIHPDPSTAAAGAGAAARLERLEMGSCGRGFDDKVAAAVAAAGPLISLRVLRLGGAYRLGDAGLLKVLQAAPNLQELSVPSAPRLTGSFLSRLPALAPSLTSLDLSGCGGLSGTDLSGLLGQLVGLQRLALDAIEEVDAEVLAAAGRAPCLRSLSLAFCRNVNDAALTAFAHATSNRRGNSSSSSITGAHAGLQELILDDCSAISDAGLLALLDSRDGCRSLQRLSLGHCCKLTDASLVSLAERGMLESLGLNSLPNIGPATLQALGRSCGEVLMELDISFCRGLTEGAVGALVDRCSKLQRLSVYGCTQLTQRFLYGHSREVLEVLGVPTSCL